MSSEYVYPQEFLNKVNDAIASKDITGFYAILKDKGTTQAQRTFVRQLINGRYGSFSSPDFTPFYDPTFTSRISEDAKKILDEAVKNFDPSKVTEESIAESLEFHRTAYPEVIKVDLDSLTENQRVFDDCVKANIEYNAKQSDHKYLVILNAEHIHRLEKSVKSEHWNAEDAIQLEYHKRMREFLKQEAAEYDF